MQIAFRDPGKGHFYISLIKSIMRFGACGFLIAGNFVLAGVLFFLAEVLGIVEEIV